MTHQLTAVSQRHTLEVPERVELLCCFQVPAAAPTVGAWIRSRGCGSWLILPRAQGLWMTHVSPPCSLPTSLLFLLFRLCIEKFLHKLCTSGRKPRAWFVVCVSGTQWTYPRCCVFPQMKTHALGWWAWEETAWAASRLSAPEQWPLFCVFSESWKLWLL